jgi:hypothetical protein
MISAALALFQKSGANVFSSSFAISICLASRSKIPPQRTKALHNPLYLFGCCHKFINFFLIANILKIVDFRFIRFQILFETTVLGISTKAFPAVRCNLRAAPSSQSPQDFHCHQG